MNSMKFYWFSCALILFLSLFPLLKSYDPYNPQNNPSPYSDSDSLLSPGSLFPLSNEFPSARVLHSLDSSEDYLFVFGGYSSNGSMLGDINIFHIPSERWSGPIVRRECCNDGSFEIDSIGADRNVGNITFLKVGFQGDFPLPRVDHASCVLNDVLYIHGGETDRNSYGLLNDLYEFDPKSIRWKVVDITMGISGVVPRRRAGHIMVADAARSRFLLFGGRHEKSSGDFIGLSDLWSFDVSTLRWQRLDEPNVNSFSAKQSSPSGRHHSAAALVDEQFFVVYGGSNPSSGLLFDDIWLFDLNMGKWRQLYSTAAHNSPIPVYEFSPPPMEHAHIFPVAGASGASEGILVYGGVGTGGGCISADCNNKQVAFGQLYFYSFDKESWTRPFFDTHRDQFGEQTTAHWLYARLHDHFQEKRIKEYAYEKVTLIQNRMLLFEFGGLQANANSVRRNGQQSTIVGISSEGTSISPPLRSSDQSVGGRIPATFSDTLTGEYLRDSVIAPTNSFWNVQSALFNGSIYLDDMNGTIIFHQNLRVYTVSSRDLVLIDSFSPSPQ